VRERIDGCQAVSKIPMLMAVDEEGGTVTRVSDYYRDYRFRAPRYIFEDGGWDAIEADTREKCELLLRLHLNMNLAPVADIAGDPYDFMYDRSFGTDLDATCEFIRMTVEIMNEYGVACSLKHFPGYGNNEDTHTGMAIDYRDAETFYNEDFLPFIAGIEAGAGTIMVSHNVVTCFDPEYPASLSPELHELARHLGFEGVLMTDDLAMGAIQEYCGENSAAVLAVLAGNDMLIADDFSTLSSVTSSDYLSGLTKPGTMPGAQIESVSGQYLSMPDSETYDLAFTALYRADGERTAGQMVQMHLMFRRGTDNHMILTSANLDFQSTEPPAPTEDEEADEEE
jgi:beta-N-acetylhexosaminidase